MKPTLVGIISDTHGLLRPGAVTAFAGCELILHAGDVGGSEILAGLRRVAPVVAVRANLDGDDADVVITGHSHQPAIARVGGVLHVNPGSAGPRRFRLPVTVALLEIADGQARARIVEVDG